MSAFFMGWDLMRIPAQERGAGSGEQAAQPSRRISTMQICSLLPAPRSWGRRGFGGWR